MKNWIKKSATTAAKAMVKMDKAHRAATRPLVERIYGEVWTEAEGRWERLLTRALRGQDIQAEAEELLTLLADLGAFIGKTLEVSRWSIQWETPARGGKDLRRLEVRFPHYSDTWDAWIVPRPLAFEVRWLEEEEEDLEPEERLRAVFKDEQLKLLKWIHNGQQQALGKSESDWSHFRCIDSDLADWITDHLLDKQEELDKAKKDFRWVLNPNSDGSWWIELKPRS